MWDFGSFEVVRFAKLFTPRDVDGSPPLVIGQSFSLIRQQIPYFRNKFKCTNIFVFISQLSVLFPDCRVSRLDEVCFEKFQQCSSLT